MHLLNVHPWFKVNQHLIRAQSQCLISGLGACFGKPGELRRPLGCRREWQSRAHCRTQQLQLIPFSLDRAAAAFTKSSPRVWCPRRWKSQPAHTLPPPNEAFSTPTQPRPEPSRVALWPGSCVLLESVLDFFWGTAQKDAPASRRPATGRGGPAHGWSWKRTHKKAHSCQRSGLSQSTMCCMTAAANTGVMVGNGSRGEGQGRNRPHRPQCNLGSAGWMRELSLGCFSTKLS